MGSVTDIVTSGDNDPPIYPVRYYNHYMYCDHCGSFEIKHWIEPENYQQLEKIQKRLSRVVAWALFFTIIALILALLGIFIFLILSLAVFIGAMIVKSRISSRIQYKGVYCVKCKTRYEYGTSFFQELEHNPRNYTMDNVPRPLYLTYQIQGETIGPADD